MDWLADLFRENSAALPFLNGTSPFQHASEINQVNVASFRRFGKSPKKSDLRLHFKLLSATSDANCHLMNCTRKAAHFPALKDLILCQCCFYLIPRQSKLKTSPDSVINVIIGKDKASPSSLLIPTATSSSQLNLLPQPLIVLPSLVNSRLITLKWRWSLRNKQFPLSERYCCWQRSWHKARVSTSGF